jgi:hypothetical protein
VNRNRIASLLQRRRQSLRWRVRHENPQRLFRSQYVAALEAQRRALAAAERAEVVPWPHGSLRRRPYMPAPLTPDQQAATLNRELVIGANRGR